jgi:hypothetical protein
VRLCNRRGRRPEALVKALGEGLLHTALDGCRSHSLGLMKTSQQLALAPRERVQALRVHVRLARLAGERAQLSEHRAQVGSQPARMLAVHRV